MQQQYLSFLYFLLLGITLGVIYSLLSGFVYICKKFTPIQIVCDLLFSVCLGFGFLWLINKLNSGEIRWYLVFATVIGIILHLKTLGKLFAKGGILLYNHLVKLNDKFKKSKVGKVLYKWKCILKTIQQKYFQLLLFA